MSKATRRRARTSRWRALVFPVAVLLGVVLIAIRDAAGSATWIATGMRFGAFWAAIFEYRSIREREDDDWRFVLGLLLSAVLAHLGWALLNPASAPRSLVPLLEWRTGFASAFVLLGPVLTAPGRGHGDRRWRYLSNALLCLPLALATARLGCIAEGCCNGALLPAPVVPLIDVVLLLTLRWGTMRLAFLRRPHALVTGLVAINLVNHLLRLTPSETSGAVLLALPAVGFVALLMVWPENHYPRSRLYVEPRVLP